MGRGELLGPVAPDRADEVMAWLADVADGASFDVKTTEAPQYRRVRMEREGREPSGVASGRPGVLAGDGFAFVSHTGEIYPSGFLPASTGNVREDSLVDAYRESDLFATLRDRDALRGKCGACEYRHVCGGSRSRAYAHTGDPFASDPLCPYVPDGWSGEGANGARSGDELGRATCQKRVD